MDDVEKIILAVAVLVSTIIFCVLENQVAESELRVAQIREQLHAPGPVE
jgi:hypothetical protein